MIIATLFLASFSFNASSKMTTLAQTYEIEEISLLEVILSKAKQKIENGEYENYKKQMLQSSKKYLARPVGVVLPKATETLTRIFDPSITLQKDIYAGETLMHKRGTVINPLSIKPLAKKIIFIDGDDPQQVSFAIDIQKKSSMIDKIVLVRGSLKELSTKHQTRFYFDQQSSLPEKKRMSLVRQLGIKKVPSIVYQKNSTEMFLRITEVQLP